MIKIVFYYVSTVNTYYALRAADLSARWHCHRSHGIGEVGEMEGGGGAGQVELRTQGLIYSHHDITGGTEKAVQQELQKYTDEMNEPHHYTLYF